MSVSLNIDTVRRTAESRKMEFQRIIDGLRVEGDQVILDSDEQLAALAEKMIVGPEVLLDRKSESRDLVAGVRIYRSGQGFQRVAQRDGRDYYTYEHLATTSDAPELMALRLKLHCTDAEHVVLNPGHGSKELIYVLQGQVRMDWESDGERHHTVLEPGDSAYLRPDVAHSFIAHSGAAEIIAVNYGRW
jgi:uncharacterized RmlC-like cupin family protein